jgi:hypothetical protein
MRASEVFVAAAVAPGSLESTASCALLKASTERMTVDWRHRTPARQRAKNVPRATRSDLDHQRTS